MILLHTRKDKDKVVLYFKHKSGELVGYSFDPEHYFLKITNNESNADLSGWDYTYLSGKNKKLFEKKYCKPSDEVNIIKTLNKQQLYDTNKDYLDDFLLRNKISLYVSYEHLKKHMGDTSVDRLKPIIQQYQLKRLAIAIKVEPSTKLPTPIPIWENFHVQYLGHPMCLLKRFKTQRITEINCYDPETQELFNFNDKNESTLITDFLVHYGKFDPDVVEMYNWLKMSYLYHRCIYLSEGENPQNSPDTLAFTFLRTINRIPVNFKPTQDELSGFCFPHHKLINKNNTYNTTQWFSYDDYASVNDKNKFGFKKRLFGRIVLELRTFYADEYVCSPTNPVWVHDKIAGGNYLEIMLELTGKDIYLPYYNYDYSIKRTIQLVKKHNPDTVFPCLTHSVFGTGGGIMSKTEGIIYRDGHIRDIDFTSFYTWLTYQYNLSKETTTGTGTEKFFFNDGKSYHYHFDKSTKLGCVPNTCKIMLEGREEIKKAIRETKDVELTGQLKIKEAAIKLNSVMIFGVVYNNTHTSNILSSPDVSSSVTMLGREYLLALEKILVENGCIVISKTTDGLKIHTQRPIEEIEELLKTSKIRDKPFNAPIKEKYTALLCVSTGWVGLDENGEFVQKGVISRIQPPVIRELNHNLYEYILRNKDGNDGFLECIKTTLEKFDTLNCLDGKNVKLDFDDCSFKTKDYLSKKKTVYEKCVQIRKIFTKIDVDDKIRIIIDDWYKGIQ